MTYLALGNIFLVVTNSAIIRVGGSVVLALEKLKRWLVGTTNQLVGPALFVIYVASTKVVVVPNFICENGVSCSYYFDCGNNFRW